MLSRALRRLGETTTREVALRPREGYENREIADRLEISLSSVERKLRVVREVWREELEGSPGRCKRENPATISPGLG
jgi:DNA-directed RNA polymerase specialized sigma24 family protein